MESPWAPHHPDIQMRKEFSMKRSAMLVLLVVLGLAAGSCGGSDDVITVYSGRTSNLIGPLLEDFADSTGIDIEVRYGQSADLALLIDQEGDRSPADIFISQSPGAVGFLAGKGKLRPIGDEVLGLVPREFRNAAGLWIGISGRVRVIVYNRDLVDPSELPASVFELTEERFRDRVAVAPANGSFQDFVTAMRETHGDDTTLAWLEGLVANDARTYANNTSIVQAVGRGDVPMGLVNHYYNFRAKAEDPGVASENYYFPDRNIGSLMIVTAIGVLSTSDVPELADQLVEYMLGEEAQRFYSEKTFEYPLAAGVAPSSVLPALSSIGVATYDFDRLGGGLERTKELIDESGLEHS
ncbi:MAG: iron ABC transporter substrate-binding protein [Acidimicrobiia bacterium]|nr:iron ABC transporter substrate-binding protein [Acidimicrobiia bacterium]MYB45624.1 iron ABC transporter substrate-binding protein [Acidimicrobiia bacterium]MYC86139.1 iron ABC transporter substrate-binding protein [Acidimicrobiia bacterium]